jgi:hypothetical protein
MLLQPEEPGVSIIKYHSHHEIEKQNMSVLLFLFFGLTYMPCLYPDDEIEHLDLFLKFNFSPH